MLLPEKIWRRQPGDFFCLSTGIRDGDRVVQWEDWWVSRDEFNELEPFIKEHEKEEVYFCPHGFVHQRRVKNNAAIPNILYADLDEVDPHKLGDLEPTIAWQTSPGRYAAAWVLRDGAFTEDLNQRLTYRIGADLSGWDLCQVLRVPGTWNHKYDEPFLIKLLWDNGPEYRLKDMEQLVGRHVKYSLAVREIYKKWERQLPAFVRKELFTKNRTTVGSRSDVLWRLNRSMVEAGLPADDIFALLRASPWNKFADRRDGDKQLRREIEKSVDKMFLISEAVEDSPSNFKFEPKAISEITEEPVDWLWPNYLARGFVTMLEGDPGLGKSYAAMMVAKAVVDNDVLPGGTKRIPQGRVIYFDLENSAAHVTKPRLLANGLSNEKDFLVEERLFSIDDVEALSKVYEGIDRIRPSLVVFDPISYYLGKSDTHKASETTQALEPFTEIARRYKCAVLLLRHLTKNTKTSPLYRGQGSIAFIGGARIGLTSAWIPGDTDRRAIVQIKNNLGPMVRDALTFRIDEVRLTAKEKQTLNGHASLARSKFSWGESIKITAHELLSSSAATEAVKEQVTFEAVQSFLNNLLDEGPVEERSVMRACEARGLVMRDVRKFAVDCNVETTTEGKGTVKKVWWSIKL